MVRPVRVKRESIAIDPYAIPAVQRPDVFWLLAAAVRRSAVALLLGVSLAHSQAAFPRLRAGTQLTYQVQGQELRSSQAKEDEIKTFEAGLKYQAAHGEMSQKEAQKQLDDARKDIEADRMQMNMTVVLATDGSAVLVTSSTQGQSGKTLTLIHPEFTFSRAPTGEATYVSAKTLESVPLLPFVGATVGCLDEFLSIDPNSLRNPGHSNTGLAMSGRANNKAGEMNYSPAFIERDASGKPTKVMVGYQFAPSFQLAVKSYSDANGVTVPSEYEQVNASSLRAGGKMFPTESYKFKLANAKEVTDPNLYKPENYLKKGDPVSVDGQRSFYYDPAKGTLEQQATKAEKDLGLARLDKEAAKTGPAGVIPTLAAMLVAAGVFAWRRTRRRGEPVRS